MKADHWTTTGGAAFVQHRGMESIELKNEGEAVLNDLVFANGTIEFDVDSTDPLGAGIGFRRRDKDSFENFYLRTYPECVKNGDCLQYAPQTHGVLLWDLFPQYQAPAAFKTDDWNHIKLVISGSRMNVFLNGSQIPLMRIGRLEGDAFQGGILLQGPGYFTNLSVIEGAVEGLSPEPEPDTTANDQRYLRNWRLSPASTLVAGKDPTASEMPAATAAWQPLTAERAGLVNISRVYGHPIPPFKPDRALAWIKTTIHSNTSQNKKVEFGWVGEAWIYVNGKLVYADKNQYWDAKTKKAPDGRCSLMNGSFLLPLEAGDNDVTLALDNHFYGWAFIFRFDDLNGISLPAPAPLAPGAYFGLKLPGETPELFAPGIINISGRNVGHLAFSPDGLECYFTIFDFDEKKGYNNSRMLFTRYQNGAWTPQLPVPFVSGKENFEPLFSRDGNRLYFGVRNSSSDTDFWTVHRASRNEEWSDPQPLGAPFNSPKEEWNLAQTADGTMYFASNRDGGMGGLDIYRTVFKPGQPLQIENLGAPVNSKFDDGDPGISPDGKTRAFYSVPNRPGVTSGSDLFICFDNGHGGWTEPVNMGEGFNTPGDEFAATFSQDGRVLFFARFDGKQGSVYWVSTTALECFRKLSH